MENGSQVVGKAHDFAYCDYWITAEQMHQVLENTYWSYII